MTEPRLEWNGSDELHLLLEGDWSVYAVGHTAAETEVVLLRHDDPADQ